MKKLLLILPLIILAACKNGDEPRVPQSTTITFGTASSTMGLEWENGHGSTRAGDDILCQLPENIGVFAYCNKSSGQEVFNNLEVLYFYSEKYTQKQFQWDYWDGPQGERISAWPYTLTSGGSEQKQWEKRNYRFAAYSPWSQNGVSVSTPDYNFSTLSWADIPEYSDTDYLISNSIVAVNNADGKRRTSDLVPFEMQHLMARIRFIFKMSEDYRKIRRIVINSMSVQASGKQNSATITYKADNSLNAISWGNLTGGTPTALNLIKEGDDAYDVQTDYDDASPFASLYILPQTGFRELTLTVNYTTYDSTGTETRNAVISNTVILATPWNLTAGKYYDLKISIIPDYLYVLSDNDQDFDGWVIISEHQI